MEDIADGYLENLIRRNLVMGTKKSFGGKIKACYIHDLLHDFCKEKAKEENLLLCIKRDQHTNPSYLVCYDKQLAHRTFVYGDGYRIGDWSSFLPYVGSIILHSYAFRTVSHNFHSFKLLKVLDLEYIIIDSIPVNLVYLRYFAARTQVSSLSSFIVNRWNLETLILRDSHYRYTHMSLPFALWEMVKLRYLHISKCNFIIEIAEESLENSKKLYDLKTLSTPYFSCIQDAELILRRTPNLRELRCEVDGVDNFQYYVLKFPTWIGILKIFGRYTSFLAKTIPFSISAPNLKNLIVGGFYMYPQHLSEIASFQNLQVLKLQRIHFENEEWEVRDGEFSGLRVLKLQMIKFFKEWSVADDAFPNLEHLALHECKYLKEIPSCFGDLCSLKSIKVEYCNKFVEKSARDIWETQVEDYQNTSFVVIIQECWNTNNSDSDDDNNDDDNGGSDCGDDDGDADNNDDDNGGNDCGDDDDGDADNNDDNSGVCGGDDRDADNNDDDSGGGGDDGDADNNDDDSGGSSGSSGDDDNNDSDEEKEDEYLAKAIWKIMSFYS